MQGSVPLYYQGVRPLKGTADSIRKKVHQGLPSTGKGVKEKRSRDGGGCTPREFLLLQKFSG